MDSSEQGSRHSQQQENQSPALPIRRRSTRVIHQQQQGDVNDPKLASAAAIAGPSNNENKKQRKGITLEGGKKTKHAEKATRKQNLLNSAGSSKRSQGTKVLRGTRPRVTAVTPPSRRRPIKAKAKAGNLQAKASTIEVSIPLINRTRLTKSAKIGSTQSSVTERFGEDQSAASSQQQLGADNKRKRRLSSSSVSDGSRSGSETTSLAYKAKRRRHTEGDLLPTTASAENMGREKNKGKHREDNNGNGEQDVSSGSSRGSRKSKSRRSSHATSSKRQSSESLSTPEPSPSRVAATQPTSQQTAEDPTSPMSMDTSDDTSDVRQPVSNSSRRRRGRRARGSESDASKKPTLSSQDNPEELDHPDYDIEDDEENEDDMEADYGNDGFGDGASAARRSEMAALFSFGGIRMSSQGGGASSSRFSDMLRQLKDQNDQTMQMVALQELSELLSMATEDMFIGHGSQSMAGFNTHDFVKALVDIIRGPSPDSLGDDIPAEMLAELGMAAHELGLGGAGPNPELMLLACRCLSNLIEAHPSSTMHVLQHGAVSVLVGKLMEVEYIDLAEQVLSVLGKISQEYPSAIIRANGLLAVLQYIDFFSLHVQRTAVSIAANACRGLNKLPSDTSSLLGDSSESGRADKHAQTFGMIKEVLPIFERLLSYADQKLVEQVVRALGRIVDWCSASMERSEKLITTSFLRTISTLVNPVTAPSTVTSNPAIFTQLIKLLASAARSSPKLAMEMLQDHDIVNLVRGYLTGGRITDSNDLDEIETEVLSAAVTQVVVTRPVDQVTEVLNLALSLLPTLPREDVWDLNNDQSGVPRVELSQQKGQTDAKGRPPPSPAKSTPSPQSSSDVVNADATGTTGTSSRSATAGKGKPALSPHDASHFKLLQEHPELVNSYTQQILPILIEVFGATVNANVRRKVVEGVGKGVWYSSDSSVLADVLARNSVFGKFISELLSLREIGLRRTVPDKERREALALVAGGLQIALVVIRKCGPSYRTWFAREGALEEMSKMISMDESDRVEVELAATAAEAASTLSDQQGTPTSSTAATTSGLPVPMSRRLSDLVRDLKRLRDQVAGHIGTSSAAPGSSAAGTTAGQSAVARRQDEMDELLDTVEAIARAPIGTASTDQPTPSAEPTQNADLSIQTNRDSASGDNSDNPLSAGSASSTGDLNSTTSILQGMRDALERLNRTSASANSSRQRSLGTVGGGTVMGLNNERYPESGVRKWIISQCRRTIESHPTTPTTSGKMDEVLAELVHLGEILSGKVPPSNKDPLMLDTLRVVAERFSRNKATDVGVGVTGYEILESGLMQALSDFLTKPGATDITVPLSDTERPEYALSLALRLKSFLHVFLNGPTPDPANRSFFVPGGFKRTVQLLQESLSRVESFDVVSATQASSAFSYDGMFGGLMSGGSFGTENSSNSPSMQLTRQLRIKLVAEEPETVPKQYESVLISVHAIAPFKALEDYLKGRVGNAPDFEKKDAAAEGGSAAKASGTEDAVASSSGLEPDEEAEPKDSDEEDAEEKDHRENVEASVRAALGDGAEDDDENEEGDDDDDQHDMDEDEDIEEDYEDDDDLGDDETVNVSDLLLHSEEARRQSRRGSQFNETEGGAASADATGGSGEGSRRDSVVDVRADIGSPAPSSQSKDATDARVGTPKQPSAATPSSASTPGVPTTEGTSTSSSKSSKPAAAATTGSMRSYASAVTTSTNFSLQFSIGDVEIPRDMTIFGAAFQHEQRRVSSGQQPNVWQAMYTIKYKKVATPSSPASASEKGATTPQSKTQESIVPPVVPTAERPTRIKLPFKTEPPEGISLETPAGQILYVLRLLYGLNTRWSEVYANEDEFQNHFTAVGETAPAALPLQEGSQSITRVAVTSRSAAPISIEALPATAFVNTKLTAKLNRQLDEPLIVASHVLPKWCASLAKEFSFLVPFETRLIYLQSTSFGYSRSMGRWQHQQQQSQNASDTHNRNNRSDGTAQLGRIQRQKVRIARHRILDSMVKVMELYGSTQALLEVEFFDEVGTGLGPTLEFYSNVCRELRKRQGVSLGPAPEKLRVWRDDDVIVEDVHDSADDATTTTTKEKGKTVELPAEYLNPSLGFFPSPLSPHQLSTPSGRQTLTLFKALGTFVGKALLDSRIVDLPFNPIFLEMVVGEEEEEELLAERAFGVDGRKGAEFHVLRHIDPALYKSLLDLKKYVSQKDVIEGDTTLTPEEKAARLRNVTVKDARIEDLCLDFTLPGYPDLDLCPNGKNTPLTLANLESYIEHVVEMSVGTGILTQIESFRSGFDRVFPVADLRSFTVQELGVLVSGSETENWEYDVLRQSIKADHGYTSDSRVILQLATYMSQLSPLHRREFLQFVTGSPKLPIGGFGALSPPLTVVRKTVDAGRKPDDFLPSVMTCVNYLKVPEYSDFEVLQARFEVAVREGQGCFHLS